jgi:beta-glucosidase
MCRSILAACFSMKLDEQRNTPAPPVDFAAHVQVALETAREGIVLLQNDGILPIGPGVRNVLVTGPYVETLAMGLGAAKVIGFDTVTMLDALKAEFGDRVTFVARPTAEELRAADVVLCNVGTCDSEGYDRPFALPDDQEQAVRACVDNNPNTVVIVTSGSGVRMTDWAPRARAVLYAWYGGQIGNVALAEILVGKTNPSGKLPITIEREFSDSPGDGYLPPGESLYVGFRDEEEKTRAVWDLRYEEGVFVGYRWYDEKGRAPLYPFGHGLSYTRFEYAGLEVTPEVVAGGAPVTVSFTVTNTGAVAGD